jgi:uncharacterized membrane protein YvlD (DUF360 family)
VAVPENVVAETVPPVIDKIFVLGLYVNVLALFTVFVAVVVAVLYAKMTG